MKDTSIHSAKFVGSFPDFSKCPKDGKAEYAFIGRSNVGKSSLVNFLTNRNGLAKISSKPGKTQMINYFLIDENWYLVDLPGYGYAKISKKHRASLGKMIRSYITQRHQLVNTFVLIDSRIKPQEIDIEFLKTLGEKGVPFSIIFTKMDKPNNEKTQKKTDSFKEILSEYWEELPPLFYTSASKKHGREELLEYIQGINNTLKIQGT